MTDRYTKALLSVIAVTSALLLTSCSNPDTSGGVTLSKGADDANEFPHGSCEGPGKNPPTYDLGCGWINGNEWGYYIMPDAYLVHEHLSMANLTGANLSYANLGRALLLITNLTNADLRDADLTGVRLGYATLTNAYLRGANLTNADLNHADLNHADLGGAVLSGANLRDANLSGADLSGVLANSSTICPNGKKWGATGNNCGF